MGEKWASWKINGKGENCIFLGRMTFFTFEHPPPHQLIWKTEWHSPTKTLKNWVTAPSLKNIKTEQPQHQVTPSPSHYLCPLPECCLLLGHYHNVLLLIMGESHTEWVMKRSSTRLVDFVAGMLLFIRPVPASSCRGVQSATSCSLSGVVGYGSGWNSMSSWLPSHLFLGPL